MALATEADVEMALGRLLTDSEDVSTLLEQASDRVAGHLGWRPDPMAHPEVSRVVALMVVAVLTKPAATRADYAVGGYNEVRESLTVKLNEESATTTGPWMSREHKATLRHLVRSRAFSIDTMGDPDASTV